MSRGPETTFIGSIHKLLPKKEGVYWMKNHNEYNGGIADCWYDHKRDLWVEYKFIAVPKRPDTVIDLINPKGKKQIRDLSLLQQEWLRDRCTNGRNVAVIIGSKDGGIWLPGIEWDRTFTTAEYLERLQTRKELANIILESVGYEP